MTLAELDALIAARPQATEIRLTPADWHATMEDPAAAVHQTPAAPNGYHYRGLRVWVCLDEAPSQVVGIKMPRAAEADRGE